MRSVALEAGMQRRDFIKVLGITAILSPLEARAQDPGNKRLIGFLSSRSAEESAPVIAAYKSGLSEMGYVDGQNISIVFQWADGKYERLPALATELVERNVAVIFAAGTDLPANAAKAATTTIPIVFLTGGDPARTGLVASINRPGGNTTGVTLYSRAILQKRLELLRDLISRAGASFAVLLNPTNPNDTTSRSDVENAARSLGIEIRIFYASTERELEDSFASIAKDNEGGLFVGTDPFFSAQRGQIVELARHYSLPAIYDSRLQVVAGGLVSYGASYLETYLQAGKYTAQILDGKRPSDLPVLLPAKFELVVNLKTAKELGVSVPPTLLARADEVIE